MKKILSLLLSLLMILTFCSCGIKTQDNENLTGTWVLQEGKTDLSTIVFYSDGTCLVDNDENGSWSIVDGTLKILGPYGGQFWDHDNIVSSYSLSNGKLILTNPVVDGANRDGQIIYYKTAG